MVSGSKVPELLIVVTDNEGQLRLKMQPKQPGLFSGSAAFGATDRIYWCVRGPPV